MSAPAPQLFGTATLSGRERYQLLTSLVVPRPIGWLSTRSREGRNNLAPFSYFAALSPTPMLVGVSIGRRGGAAKDSLRNIRETGAFCINLVTEALLEAMNATSAEAPPEVDEFELAGLCAAEAGSVAAPYVAASPAVLECRLFKEVALGEPPPDGEPVRRGAPGSNTLVIGEVVAVRLAAEARLLEGSHFVDILPLRPVGRLWGPTYNVVRGALALERPSWPPPER